ncbi:flavodoxin family protein [Streptomyces synnematoformans]|uniref:Flavodoxin family protein n=1 Tax=Streptomyces synnematoformans TaxID=415721 RepID=A0ABP5L572_9ACTN
MDRSPRVSIAYHSRRGHTRVLAQAVRAGAEDEGAAVTMVLVEDVQESDWETLDASDAIVFGAPTLMGSASGAFHAFAEATSKRWGTESWKDKIGAGFTHSSCKAGDKHITLGYFATLAAQHQMHWVNLGLAPGWHLSHESEGDLNRLGYFNGAAAATMGDLGTDSVHKADIATAEHLGRRVARHTAVVLAGRAVLGIG